MRLKDYFFDQFLGALTATSAPPTNLTETWFSKNKKSQQVDYGIIDLEQSETYTKVEINIALPKILIKDRPHFKEALILEVEAIQLTNSADFVTGRWYNFPEKLFKEQTFHVFVEKATLKYNTEIISNTFDLNIDIKNPENTPVSDSVPHSELDKSLQIDIFISQLLKLKLCQKVYTYLLRCLDLNLNYNDEMQHEHEFKNFIDLERIEMDQQSFASMRVGVIIDHFSIEIRNNDDSFIAEVIHENANITYLDKGIKEIKIWSNEYYILEEQKQDFKNIIMAPIKSRNVLKDQDLFKKSSRQQHYSMEIIMHPSGDKAITWTLSKVKVFCNLYLIRNLLSFFTEAMPDYDYSSEKPNGYYKRNGELASKDPQSKMTFILEFQKSIFLMTNEQQADKVVVFDTNLNFTFHRENYQQCKELLKVKYDKECNKFKLMNSFEGTENFTPENEIQMPVGFMTVNLLDAYFRI